MAEGFAGARNGQQFECALPVAADRAKEIDFHLRPSGKPQMFRLRGPVWSYTPGAAIATCALAKAFTLTPELSIHGVQVGFSESAQYSIEQKNDVATRILDSALSLQLPPPSMANLASDLRVVSTSELGHRAEEPRSRNNFFDDGDFANNITAGASSLAMARACGHDRGAGGWVPSGAVAEGRRSSCYLAAQTLAGSLLGPQTGRQLSLRPSRLPQQCPPALGLSWRD